MVDDGILTPKSQIRNICRYLDLVCPEIALVIDPDFLAIVCSGIIGDQACVSRPEGSAPYTG